MLKENSIISESPAKIRTTKKPSYRRRNGKSDIRAWGKRLAGDTAPHRAGEAGEGESDTRPRCAQLHGGIKPCKEMDFWHSDITGVGPPTRKEQTGAAKGGRTRQWERTDFELWGLG
ncbi:hypothetical protein YC2023_108886 [Brassica napus]